MIEPRSPIRQFVRASGVMALLYAGSTALSFAVGVVLARLLGASGFGTYALAMTTATLVGLITEFGLPTLAMREAGVARASGEWSLLRGLLRWSDRAIVAVSLVLAVGTWSVLAATSATANSAYLAAMLWGVVLVPLTAASKLRASVLLALDHVASGQFAAMILRPLVFVALCLLLAWRGPAFTAPLAMMAQVVGAFAALIVVQALYLRHRPRLLIEARPTYAVRGWMAACLPMGVTEGLRLLQGQLALLLTGWLATAAAAGVYRVADAVLQVPTIVASIVATAATPMFGRLYKQGDRAEIERIAVLAAVIMLGGMIVLGAPLALAAPWLIPALFGPEFAASAPVCLILWIGLTATYALGLPHSIANMTGHQVLSTHSFLIVVAINFGGGCLLVPRFGAAGAAVAMACGSFAGIAWCAWRLSRATGCNPTLINRAAPAIIAAAATAGLGALRRKLQKG